MPGSRHQSTGRIAISHCAALGIAASLGWLLQLVGALPALDDLLYDRCLSLAGIVRETPVSVVLVPASTETLAAEDDCRRLVTSLDALGAKGIAFTQPLSGWSATSRGRAWVIVPEQYHDPLPSPAGQDSAGWNTTSCDVGFVRSRDGIYRSQEMSFAGRFGVRRSLEAAIADRWFDGDAEAPDGQFLVRFQGGDKPLPMVPADVVLSNGLVPDLVRGRMVLIGPDRIPGSPGLTGPVPGAVAMTPLQAHGEAVNSLLTRTWISMLSTPLTALMVILGGGVTYLLCVRFPQNRGRLLWSLLGLELLLGWTAVTFAGVWIPVGFVWGTQVLAVLASSMRSRWHLSDLIRRLAYQVRTYVRLRQRTDNPEPTVIPWRRQLATTDSSAVLCHGLDWLQFEFGLLEHVFDEISTGFALYDGTGVRLRENRCFRDYAPDQFSNDSSANLESLLGSLLSGADDVRRIQRQLLLRKSPVSLTVPGPDGTSEDHVRLRPIEYRWSSPLTSIDSSTISSVRLIICEWNRTELHVEPGTDRAAELLEAIESLQGIVREGSDIFGEEQPVNSDADWGRVSSAEMGDHRHPHLVPKASAEPAHA